MMDSSRLRCVAAMMRTSHSVCSVAADALEDALLQHAQQLHLHGQAHVADLVEEQRAALGDLEAALARGDGAGERALLVTEQLALEQLGGNGAAVDGDEGTLTARAQRRGSREPRSPCRYRIPLG